MPAEVMDSVGKAAIMKQIHEHRRLFWASGIIAVIAGLAALALPFAATLAANFLVGAILVASGVVEVASAFDARKIRRFIAPFLLGVVAVIAGLILLFAPGVGILALTMTITAFLLANGLLKVFFAFSMRDAEGWVWMLVSGVLSLILGVLLLLGLPEISYWVLGLFLGIDLLFYGVSMIALVVAARRHAEGRDESHSADATG